MSKRKHAPSAFFGHNVWWRNNDVKENDRTVYWNPEKGWADKRNALVDQINIIYSKGCL